jgi:hypothetical protein
VHSVNYRSVLQPACLALILLAFLAAACSPSGSQQPAGTYFVPPTQDSGLANQPVIENTPMLVSLPTATLQCKDNLAFKKDVTIPDGTLVSPDSTLDKRWEVENSGNCNWSQGYRVRLVAGSELGAQKEQSLFPARSGSRAIIRMVFKAPAEAGTYRSAWQAYTPQGEAFGDPFFIEITVGTATPTP